MNSNLRKTLTLALALLFGGMGVFLSAQEHPVGVRSLTEAERGEALRDFVEYVAPATRAGLPARVVNQAHLPKVWSQGQLSICGSFSPTYYLCNYYESQRLGEGRWDYVADADKVASPQWSVTMVNHGVSDTPDGANPLTTIKRLCYLGYLTQAELPFTGSYPLECHAPTVAQQRTALRRKGGHGVVLSYLTCADAEEWLLKLKAALAEGEIFTAITDRIPASFDAYPAQGDGKEFEVDSNNHGVFAWPSGKTRSPHALAVIGYDDDLEYTDKDGEIRHGALLAVNSWGTGWGVAVNGEGGYIWVGYDAVLTHGFLEWEVYSMTVGAGDYQPALTAVVTLSESGFEKRWKQVMMGKAVRHWAGGVTFKLNGLEFENPLWGISPYVGGLEADPNQTELLLDLTGFQNARLLQLDQEMAFGRDTAPVGKILRTAFYDQEETPIRTLEQDALIKPYHPSSYPIFSTTVASLQETADALPALYPWTGSIQFGDLNGDGRLDMVSSVHQNNGVETGVIDNDGYLTYSEYRHDLWLKQTDGSYRQTTLALGDDPAQIILADLDGDGVLDLAASTGRRTCFLKNDGQGNFSLLAAIDHQEGQYAASGCPGYFAAGDFDNDGRPDFALANSAGTFVIRQVTPTQYTVFPLGVQRLSSTQPLRYAKGLAVGDLNGDGWQDIVVTETARYYNDGYQEASIVYCNQGAMRFTPYELPLPQLVCAAIDIADADQDGCDDILYAAGNCSNVLSNVTALRILKGRPDDAGGFRLPVPMPVDASLTPRWGGNVAWADVDLDGRLEALISGVSGSAASGSDPYGADYIQRYPPWGNSGNNLKVLRWDGEKYADSRLTLPGTTGFEGPSLMAMVDFDGDGRPDLVHGGTLCTRAISVSREGPTREVAALKCLRNEVVAANAPPTAPTGLAAQAVGNGRAVFNWTAGADAETGADGLRYILRIGTASGAGDILPGTNPVPRRSGVTMTNLPARKLYWSVRTLDATGNLSPWSAEATVNPTGTTAIPAPLDSAALPNPVALPNLSGEIDCRSADTAMGSASFYWRGGSLKVGDCIELHADPKPGYRFAYWEGDVLSPCSRVTRAYYYNQGESYVAHFLPDTSFLQAADKATGFRDAQGGLWLWGNYRNAAGQVTQETPPQLAAASGTLFFTLANQTAYYGVKGTSWHGDWEYTHWTDGSGYNQLLRAVDGKGWNWAQEYRVSDDERVERAWGGPGGLAVLYRPTAGSRRFTLSYSSNNSFSWSYDLTATVDVIDCVPQQDFLLLLNAAGKVLTMGDNSCGQLGTAGPASYSEYREIPGLPTVTAIAAGSTFAAALDTAGNVWTWGDNGAGQLGRGTRGATYPAPAKIDGLSNVVAIAAGDRHLLALQANGTLHAWGDNGQGQLGAANGRPLNGLVVTAIAAAAERSVAIAANGDLYAWGDGQAAPQVIDNTSFTPLSFTLDIDPRYADLLSVPAGVYSARAGAAVTLTADSDEESYFQYWLVDGERVDDNPLTLHPTAACMVKAVYASRSAVLSLGEPEITDTTVTVPVRMAYAATAYDGLDLLLKFSPELILDNVDFPYPEPAYKLRFEQSGEDDGLAVTRLLVFGDAKTLNHEAKGEAQLCELVFRNPGAELDATVALAGAPRLSRDLGNYEEAAILGAPSSIAVHIDGYEVVPGAPESYTKLEVSGLKAGHWNPFWLPGEPEAKTTAELAAALGVQDLTAWTWRNGLFMQATELEAGQPYLLNFIGTPSGSISYIKGDAPDISLQPGWNVLMVPQTTAMPDTALGAFRFDARAGAFVRHTGPFEPNCLYWLYIIQE